MDISSLIQSFTCLISLTCAEVEIVAVPSFVASFTEIIVPSLSVALAKGGVTELSTTALTVSVCPLLYVSVKDLVVGLYVADSNVPFSTIGSFFGSHDEQLSTREVGGHYGYCCTGPRRSRWILYLHARASG